MSQKNKNREPPTFHIDELKVESVEQASGLFFDGPHSTNNWESTSKSNTGLKVSGSATIQNVYSLVNNSDPPSKKQAEKN